MSSFSKKDIPTISLRDIENLKRPLNEDDEKMEEHFSKLKPEAKELIVREEIRHAIKMYGTDGLSIEEVEALTNRDRKTIKKHLDALIGLREVYSQKKNKQLTLYYKNGRPLWQVGKKIVDAGNTYFEISLAQGPKDKLFYHILEKRVSLLEGDKAEGGILLPLESLDEFIERLTELKQNIGDISDKEAVFTN